MIDIIKFWLIVAYKTIDKTLRDVIEFGKGVAVIFFLVLVVYISFTKENERSLVESSPDEKIISIGIIIIAYASFSLVLNFLRAHLKQKIKRGNDSLDSLKKDIINEQIKKDIERRK
jgi:hypothetical protein